MDIFSDVTGVLTNPLSKYPLYNPNKGIYTKWGEIELPWNTDILTDQWQVAEYFASIAYNAGDKVIRIEDDGYRIVLYEANVDISAPPGAFDSSLWTEICRVVVSEPVGLPSYQYLVDNFTYYSPKSAYTEWSKFNSSWSTDLTTPSSDEWGNAQIAKDYFYRAGDIVLHDTGCGDYTCVYIATADMPADFDLVTSGPPPATYWQKQYCIRNGKPNTCVKRVTCTEPNRKIVSLSSGDSDLICVPVESTTGIRPRLV